MAFCPFCNKECSSECALSIKETCALVLIAKGVNLSDTRTGKNYKTLADAADMISDQIINLH